MFYRLLQYQKQTFRVFCYAKLNVLRLRSKTSLPRKILLEVYSKRNVYYNISSKIFLEETFRNVALVHKAHKTAAAYSV